MGTIWIAAWMLSSPADATGNCTFQGRAGAFVSCIYGELQALEARHDAELAQLQGQLDDTEAALALATGELSAAQSDLTWALAELQAARDELDLLGPAVDDHTLALFDLTSRVDAIELDYLPQSMASSFLQQSDLDGYATESWVSENHLSSTYYGDVSIYESYELAFLFGYSRIEGSLTIGGQEVGELDALWFLQEVTGDLTVSNTAFLGDVDGLSNLASVGGDVRITGNYGLGNLDGLAGLTEIPGLLSIASNDALTDVSGLAQLVTVGEHLAVSNNRALVTIDGWSSLESVGGDFLVLGNLQSPSSSLLEAVRGMPLLESIGGGLEVLYAERLDDASGFSQLTSVGESVKLGNLGLTDLGAFGNLASVAIDLDVVGNPVLEDVSALSGVSVTGTLEVSENPTLCQSAVDALLPTVTYGSVTTEDNDDGC
jgi:hypothetical protein